MESAIDEDAIHPSLQDGRWPVPPERQVQDQQIRTLQCGDLAGDLRREYALARRAALLGQGAKVSGSNLSG